MASVASMHLSVTLLGGRAGELNSAADQIIGYLEASDPSGPPTASPPCRWLSGLATTDRPVWLDAVFDTRPR